MKRKYNIFLGLLLLGAAGSLQACFQQDDFAEAVPDREMQITRGRYLTASNGDPVAIANDPDKSKWFEVGTPYRLLAFTKPYSKADASDETNGVNHPRFNYVAWEGEMANGLRFVALDDNSDKWFGFSALSDETGGDEGLVSLDFYGLTYGRKEERLSTYIALDGLEGETTPAAGTLASLKRTETVTGGVLKDLMRGVRLNQNISTVGNDAFSTTQSVLPFMHCFSQLRFQVVQQPAENPDGSGTLVPSFPNLGIEDIVVTGTYGTGAVYLQDGKVELSGSTVERPLQFREGFSGKVTTQQVDVGDMIVFPSAGGALKNAGQADGYSIGLTFMVKSTVQSDIAHFLHNTGSPETIATETASDGTVWYKGRIVKTAVIDNYTDEAIRLKQNTTYTIVLSFQENGVRIITVIPQIEEWLPGEGTAENPWQEQALGQPQMFDNIVWSDRNLGADHFDPRGDDGLNFEKTIGYFYQSGRNIPYYPFNYLECRDEGRVPNFEEKNSQGLADLRTAWNNTPFRFYPIVDSRILRMSGEDDWTVAPSSGKQPQLEIPETMPDDPYVYDFLCGVNNGDSGLNSAQDMHWEDGQQNQPVKGAWVVPTSRDFLTIFPSTPHAGNITMRTGGNSAVPMNWGHAHSPRVSPGVTALRVTVPYYTSDMTDANLPTWRSEGYQNAWKTLHANQDPGTTHVNEYSQGNPGQYVSYEPEGDPEAGYASVYVISDLIGKNERGEKFNFKDSLATQKLKDNYEIEEWGTIFAIKRIYTPQAYRMRWRAKVVKEGAYSPSMYIEICRYRCSATDRLDETNYMNYDWEHPAARIYFPICGLGDWTGEYINYGTECEYATSDPIVGGKSSALQIKITGDNATNAYIAIVNKVINRNFGKQIRPILGGDNEQ